MTEAARQGSATQAGTYARIARRWWWLPLLFLIISTLVPYFSSSLFFKKVYAASITLRVTSQGTSTTVLNTNDAGAEAVVMTTVPVLDQVAKHLSAASQQDPSALYRTQCAADATDRFVTCSTTSKSPVAAAGVLNDLTTQFIKINSTTQQKQNKPVLDSIHQQEHQLRSQIDSLEQRLAQLPAGSNGSTNVSQQYLITALQGQLSQEQASLSQLTVQESQIIDSAAQTANAITVINPAAPNYSPVSPRPTRNALLGAIIGISFAVALIILFEYLNDTFRSAEEVASAVGPVIGSVRRFRGDTRSLHLVVAQDSHSPISEAYRVAAANLQYMGADQSAKVLLVTSACAGEGKTTTSANLGAALAAMGRRVLLVDADFHRRGLSKVFGATDRPGLATILQSDMVDVCGHETDVPNLRFLSAGEAPFNSGELLGSRKMKQWVATAGSRYDFVIFDVPPILSVANTRILATLSDGAILVLSPDKGSRRLARQAVAALEAVNVRVLGVIVNRISTQQEGYYAYDYDYSEYAHYSANRDPKGSKARNS